MQKNSQAVHGSEQLQNNSQVVVEEETVKERLTGSIRENCYEKGTGMREDTYPEGFISRREGNLPSIIERHNTQAA